MSTIKSSREIDSIFRDSKRVAHPLVIALVSSTPEGRGPEGRVAFIAGRRVGNAVARNRAKRVMRAAVSRAALPSPGLDIALIATPKTGTASADELDRALARLVSRLEAEG